jgi:hypothetical protein
MLLAAVLMVGSTPVRAGDFCTTPYPPGAGWSISMGRAFDWGTIGIRIGDGYDGSNWSFTHSYPGYGCDYGSYYPTYGYWSYLTSDCWPSYPYYTSYAYGYYGYYAPSYSYSYSPTYYYSPRYYSSYPSYSHGYYSSRPRYPVEGRYDSHDYRGSSRGYTSSPPPARYAERDRGQQVYWNSRTSIGGSPSIGDRPYRAPPIERSSGPSSGRSSAPSGGDRGARYR